MPVVFLIAAVAVLGGVYIAATGRGGELAVEHPDHMPLDLGPVSAPDIALLRPPTALWGYNIQVTDEALDLIARAMRDRDVTIAHLQEQLASRDVRDPGVGHLDVGNLYFRDPDATRPDSIRPDVTNTDAKVPDTRPDASRPDATYPDVTYPELSQVPQAPQPPLVSEAPQSPQAREAPCPLKAPGVLVAPLPHRPPPPAEAAQSAEATQPADTRPASYDARVQGPQGSYDTHGWWAQQEEAAREEALRQAQARTGAEARPGEASSPDESGSPGESGSAEAAGHPAGVPADPDDSGPSRTTTQPDPAITQPNPAIASSPGPPGDDPRAVAEEQGW